MKTWQKHRPSSHEHGFLSVLFKIYCVCVCVNTHLQMCVIMREDAMDLRGCRVIQGELEKERRGRHDMNIVLMYEVFKKNQK